MQDSLRTTCLAQTRYGTLCQTKPVKGKKRCRIHGGANGTGTPKGNSNAFKHGRYSAESILMRLEANQLIRQHKAMMKEFG